MHFTSAPFRRLARQVLRKTPFTSTSSPTAASCFPRFSAGSCMSGRFGGAGVSYGRSRPVLPRMSEFGEHSEVWLALSEQFFRTGTCKQILGTREYSWRRSALEWRWGAPQSSRPLLGLAGGLCGVDMVLRTSVLTITSTRVGRFCGTRESSFPASKFRLKT